MTKANAILEYLQHIGAKKEAEMYLKLFRGVEPYRFAIITIDVQTLAVYERDVAAALGYLSSLGLTPIVVHDATGSLGKQLVSDVWANGGKCQAIMAGLYTGNESAKVIAAKAKELISEKILPIIAAENLNETVKQLLRIIKPGKLMLLNRLGGVRTGKDELLSYINLPHEYGGVSKIVAADYKNVLRTSSEILAAADWKLHVEIVPPNGLLTELFTVKGSGTFVKKGPKIVKLGGSDVNKEKLKQLLEESFRKELSGSYLATEGRQEKTLYFVEENYNGVAVVNMIGGICYIDKLAVLPEVQGEGLARDLITAVMNSCRKVFWRARLENHINDWYFRLCSGVQKVGSWFVYWSNLSIKEIEAAIKYAAEKPADFVS